MFQDFAKKAISWVVVAWGCTCGYLCLIWIGRQPSDKLESSHFAGTPYLIALFGLLPLLGSLIAMWNCKRAARVFLLSAPFVFVVATVLILISDVSCRPSDFLSAFRCFREFLPTIAAIISLVFLAPGFFWWLTRRMDWPALKKSRSVSSRRKAASLVAAGLCLFVLIMAGSVMLEICGHFIDVGCDKKGAPVMAGGRYPGQAVFIAYVDIGGDKWSGTGKNQWAIATVRQKFWGLRFWNHVILTRGFFNPPESYFVEGSRSTGLLTRFLPIYDVWCSRTARLQDAGIDLRLLHDGAPKDSARIIGRVENGVSYYPLKPFVPIPGAKVLLTGPSGTEIMTTDESGIYDATSLSAGHYEVKLQYPDQNTHYTKPCNFDLKVGDVEECRISKLN